MDDIHVIYGENSEMYQSHSAFLLFGKSCSKSKPPLLNLPARSVQRPVFLEMDMLPVSIEEEKVLATSAVSMVGIGRRSWQSRHFTYLLCSVYKWPSAQCTVTLHRSLCFLCYKTTGSYTQILYKPHSTFCLHTHCTARASDTQLRFTSVNILLNYIHYKIVATELHLILNIKPYIRGQKFAFSGLVGYRNNSSGDYLKTLTL